jgi:transcriptional regulator with XRE-family HTH domain
MPPRKHPIDRDGEKALAELLAVLVARRIQLGWSQREMAARMGIGASYMCDIESGSQNFVVSTLLRYAEVVGMKIVAIVDEE